MLPLSLIVWVAFFALYLLFVGQAPGPELAAGAITSALATAYYLHVHRSEHRRFALRAPWLHLVARILSAIAVDTSRVGGALTRAMLHTTHGEGIVGQPFDPGDGTALSAGRRALVVLAASIAPNAYVIDVRGRPPELLEHRLVAGTSHQDQQWPV